MDNTYDSQDIQIKQLLADVMTKDDHDKISFEILKKKNKICIPNMEILKAYRQFIAKGEMEASDKIFSLLRKQRARSISGISAITILTKPAGCPGECVYCPTEARMPKSYLSDEPAVMRAVLNQWNAGRQVVVRLRALHDMGHPTDKCEMIILGGTFSAYDHDYMSDYILQMYNSLNEVDSKNLEKSQLINESAKHRAVGLSIETRPDHVTIEEIKRLRGFGVTKIELGVQSLYNDVLDLVKRGHKIEEVARAAKLLRDAGLKIHYHMMPNLPGSSIDRDIEMFKDLFEDPSFKPDMLKIYPCVVTVHSELEKWEKEGKYKSKSDEEVIEMLIKIKQLIPEYCRIMRLGRDIPAGDIIAGNKITNIREVVRDRMKKRDLKCECQRCREVGFADAEINNIVLYRKDYDANDGKEIYLEMRDEESKTILAFLRLRIPSYVLEGKNHFLPVLQDSALIREVHTYGFALEVDKRLDSETQHKGYGKRMVKEAERIAKEEFGLDKIAVISGVGVRGYYRKLGYELENTYMVKAI